MKHAIKYSIGIICTLVLLVPVAAAQRDRVERQQPEKLLDIAGIKPGMIVGEAGCGDGFLTFFISRRVGDKGHVYANDISSDALGRLNERRRREGITNITTVLGEVDDPSYPVKDIEVITMIYAFHDFTEKAVWLKNVKKYLKPGAALYVFDAHDSHTGMSEELVKKLGDEAGFKVTRCEEIHGGLWVYVLTERDNTTKKN